MRQFLSSLLLAVLVLSGCSRRAEYYISRGDRFLHDGKTSEAIIEYQKAIQKSPRSGEAFLRLGKALLSENESKTALQALDSAVKLMPSNEEAEADLADLCLGAYIATDTRGKALYDRARQVTDQLLSQNPRSPDGFRLKGSLALLDRQPEQAAQAFTSALEIKPGDPKSALGLAQAYFQENRFADGEKAAEDLFEKQAYLPALDFLYSHYIAAQRWEDAERVLNLKLARNPKDSATILQLARQYLVRQRNADAQRIIRRMLDQPKDFPDAPLEVADLYAQTGDWQEALRRYEEGIKSDSTRKLIYEKRRVAALVALGRRDVALDSLNEIVTAHPDDRESIETRARLWLQGGPAQKRDSAIQDLLALSEKQPGDARLHLELANAYRLKGDLGAARRQLEEVKGTDRDLNIAARLGLAELSLLEYRPAEALQRASDLLNNDRGSERARLIKSAALTGLQRYRESHDELEQLRKDFPRSADVQMQLGFLAIAEKRYSDAQKIFSSLRQPGVEDSRPIAGMAENLAIQNQMDKALELLTTESNRFPQREDLRRLLAEMAMRDAKYDLAIGQYRQLVAQEPKSSDFYMRLGDAYRQKNDLADASAMFTQAEKLAPNAIGPVLFLAITLEQAGKSDEAKSHYRRALQLQPANIIAMTNLAHLLADSGGDLDEALALARKASELAPDQPAITDTIGWVYFKKHQSASALQTFSVLTTKYPSSPTFRYHLGLAELQKGDRLLARNQIEKALASGPSPQEASEMKEALAKTR